MKTVVAFACYCGYTCTDTDGVWIAPDTGLCPSQSFDSNPVLYQNRSWVNQSAPDAPPFATGAISNVVGYIGEFSNIPLSLPTNPAPYDTNYEGTVWQNSGKIAAIVTNTNPISLATAAANCAALLDAVNLLDPAKYELYSLAGSPPYPSGRKTNTWFQYSGAAVGDGSTQTDTIFIGQDGSLYNGSGATLGATQWNSNLWIASPTSGNKPGDWPSDLDWDTAPPPMSCLVACYGSPSGTIWSEWQGTYYMFSASPTPSFSLGQIGTFTEGGEGYTPNLLFVWIMAIKTALCIKNDWNLSRSWTVDMDGTDFVPGAITDLPQVMAPGEYAFLPTDAPLGGLYGVMSAQPY